jgi:hypothetical protein
MKSQLLLTLQLLDEFGKLVRTSTLRDCKTITQRFEDEGLSFLTITLPDFAADFQKSLELGHVVHDGFYGFHRTAGLPAFLRGFLALVFDARSGALLDEPSVEAIDAVRQICLINSKLLLPSTPARERAAMEGFIKCENHVRDFDAIRTSEDVRELREVFSVLYRGVLTTLDKEVYYLEDSIRPKHGPGSTAERLLGNKKYKAWTWTTRLESIFPCRDFLIPNERFWTDLDRVSMVEPRDELPVRVISVPKTLKTPRIIAIEPVCMQYAQQAISRRLVDLLETDRVTRMLLGFTDQQPNRAMARTGSEDGSLATIDLSSASDLVSNQLVRGLFASFPSVSEALDATRSRKADVPGFGVQRLAKFASMGSALCFPIEAMVFLSLVFLGICRDLNAPVTHSLIQRYVGRVRVYGDDIIVPVEHVQSVIDCLEAFGLKVGFGKSFWNGRFRESCGGDYYNGIDVTPVRCRRVLPSSRRDAEGVISLVSMRNLLYMKGLWKTAGWLDDRIRRLIPFPIVEPTSSALGRTSVVFDYEYSRMCEKLHRPLVRAMCVHAPLPSNSLDGTGALQKFFLMRGEDPLDEEHLRRSGRPGSVRIYPRWAQPF